MNRVEKNKLKALVSVYKLSPGGVGINCPTNKAVAWVNSLTLEEYRFVVHYLNGKES